MLKYKSSKITDNLVLSVSSLMFVLSSRRVAHNGLQLGEVAEIEEQMYKICTMFNRIPNVQFSTEPAFCQTAVSCGFFFFQSIHTLLLSCQCHKGISYYLAKEDKE